MDLKQLIDEGERLARPCILLKDEGETLAGFWGGEPSGPCRDFPHWLTVNPHLLKLPFDADLVSVYSNQRDCRSGHIEVISTSIPTPADAVPLYAHGSTSLAPIEAIMRFGNAKIQSWLDSHKWRSEWGYNSNFPDTSASSYVSYWQNSHPLFLANAHAIVGGWHFQWPDEDWHERIDQQLLLWTIKDSEPWIEVWKRDDIIEVVQRIT